MSHVCTSATVFLFPITTYNYKLAKMAEFLLGNIRIHVEIPIFFLLFAFMFESFVTTNLIIYRTCYVTLNFNESDCALLGTSNISNETAELEQKVQPHAAVILMYRTLAGAIFPPLLCFFLGPWSDKYGRKPVLLASFGGFIIAYLIMIIVSAVPGASGWYILFYFVPVCITGGFPTILTVMLSYITDTTSEENRGIRMGVFEVFNTIGVLAGTLSSSFVLEAYGYVAIYSICTVCIILAWLFTFFLIPESVTDNELNDGNKLRNLFKFSLIKETVQTTFKRREGSRRAMILIVMVLMIVYVVDSVADYGIIFLYLREKFHWSLAMFTFYTSINNVMAIIGGLFGTYLLNKVFEVREAIVILLGLISGLVGSLILGLAAQNWHVYTAGASKCFTGGVRPMARSLLSKLVSTEDSGKVFSVVMALEIVGGLIGSPIYTYVYNNTLLTFPGAFNFVTSGVFVFEIILIIAVLMMQRYQNHTQIL